MQTLSSDFVSIENKKSLNSHSRRRCFPLNKMKKKEEEEEDEARNVQHSE